MGEAIGRVTGVEVAASHHQESGLTALRLGEPLEVEFGQVVGLGDPVQLELEASIRALRAGLLKEGGKRDRETGATVPACMLARHPIEPALAPAGNAEVVKI